MSRSWRAIFSGRLSAELGIPAPDWDGWDLDRLRRYDWPGNVRELRNVIERCLLLGRRPGHCIGEPRSGGSTAPDGEPDLSLAAVERAHILRVLEIADGNKSEAARRLCVSRKTLERKLKAWGADAADNCQPRWPGAQVGFASSPAPRPAAPPRPGHSRRGAGPAGRSPGPAGGR